MRLFKSIATVGVALGVGLAGEAVLSKGHHQIGSKGHATVVAQADDNHSLKLQMVDIGNKDKKIVSTTSDIKNFSVTDATTYADIVKAQIDKNQINYWAVFEYFSLINNEVTSGYPKLFGISADSYVKEKYGEATLKEARRLYVRASVYGKNYTLDTEEFNKRLEKTYLGNSTTVEVPFRESDATMTINIGWVNTIKDVNHQYKLKGMQGQTIQLEHLREFEKGSTLDTDSITFNGAESEENLYFISHLIRKTVTIKYVGPDGETLSPSVTRYGFRNQVSGAIMSPEIDGYSLEKEDDKAVSIDFEKYKVGSNERIVTYTKNDSSGGGDNGSGGNGNGNGDGGTDTDGNGNGDGNTDNGNNTVTPFQIYGKQKLYRYSHATFQNHRRTQTHAKKTRAYAPVFTVVETAKSSNGVARYKLNDGTYVTANSDYVANLYWLGNNYKTLYVTNPKGVNTYQSTTFNNKQKHLKQGTAVTVKQVVKKGEMTRYQLPNGTYITGNKQFVSPTKPKTVKQVKVKTTVRLYKDVNLTKVLKTYKKGSVINVSGWDHSRGDVHHVSGVKRYKVAGGYITANSQYVSIVK